MFNQLLINSIIAGSIYTLIALDFFLIFSPMNFVYMAIAFRNADLLMISKRRGMDIV